RKAPFRADGYTFVNLIINIKFYIKDFNLNDIEADRKLFAKIKKEIEALLEDNKDAFLNSKININFEEDKNLLKPLMVRMGYQKYSIGIRDLIRAIIKAEKDGHNLLDILMAYLEDE
ncbi:MAG: hypothetical protein ACRCX8_08930, partial [Sarcina sp.]